MDFASCRGLKVRGLARLGPQICQGVKTCHLNIFHSLNSGGPLVDLSGKAVGINVATVQGSENIGFAIPISEVQHALTQLGI